MTAPAINVPAHLLRALCAAAETLCETANWYPSARSDCFEMIVLAERVATLCAALGPLQDAGATPAQPLDRRYHPPAPAPELSDLIQATQDLLTAWFDSDAIDGTQYTMIEDDRFKELARAFDLFRARHPEVVLKENAQ